MKTISALVLSILLVAGVTGSALAYRHASGAGAYAASAAPAAAAHRPAAQVVRPGTRFRWAPCPASSRLEKGVCVTDVVRTVVVPAPPAPVQAAPPAAPAAAHVAVPVVSGGGEHEQEHGDDHGGEHEHEGEGGGGGEHEGDD